MNYRQEQPDERLKEHVRCYWCLENLTEEILRHTIMPDGFFDLLICYQNDELNDIILSGLWTERVQVNIVPGTKIFAIQFRLLAAEYFIQNRLDLLLNEVVSVRNSYEYLFQNIRPSELFVFFNDYLMSIIDQSRLIDSRKKHLLKLIDQSKGGLTVDAYSNQVFWTKRQINRYFQSRFGLSLKQYCTIRKGAVSFSHIKRGQLYPLQNYYDQSHFIKTIKKLSGTTPKELTKNENDRFLQFSIITEK